MNKNIGKTDKIIRIVVGLVIIGFGIATNSWLGVIGLIPIGTALIGLCPLYSLLNMNTICDKENCDKKE